MTSEETIEALVQSCNDLMKMVEKLKNENQFLTDTIINNNLGKITCERRQILKENRGLKKEISLLMGKINQLRS